MISVSSKIKFKDLDDFECLLTEEGIRSIEDEISKDKINVRNYTCKGNWCGIITNGTAVLGFGDIGPKAALPVMEGKSCIFKQLGGVDVVPICLKEKDPKKVIELVKRMAPTFSAINLEDIKAPDCFEIEQTLKKAIPIPVFHDDQHGTAIVCTAGLINSLKLAKLKPEETKVIINGGGAAGVSISELMHKMNFKNIIVCDTKGAIYKGRKEHMNIIKEHLADYTNPNKEEGTLEKIIKGAHIFIGVSVEGALKREWVKTMA
jgi:malate dehydrogenase (oxaloacetate-decarboxylating)